jgi:hypothetical protein
MVFSGGSGVTNVIAKFLFGAFNIFSGANLLSGGISAGTTYTLTVVFNGGSSSVRLNAGTAVTGDTGSTYPYTLAIGSNPDGTSPAPMTLHEMLVFDRLTTSEDEAILSYLRTKWGHY